MSPAPPAPARIRVAFCVDTMGMGGTELNALRTAELLDRERFDLTVVTMRPDGALRARYAAAGVPVVVYPLRSLAAPSTVPQAARLAGFFRRGGFHVVHSHDRYFNVFATVAARAAGVPVVIGSKRWLANRGASRVANALAYRLTTRVLANSDAVAASLRSDERVPARQIVVVPNFVSESAFDDVNPAERARLRSELGLAPEHLVVGVLANLRPVKDHESLLAAAAQLRERYGALRLLLVGEGDSKAALQARALDLGIGDRVVFAGHREQRTNPHRLFDVSVLCSVSEGFPNSVVEAMAAERPVVATRVGGIPDAVVEGETGLLVPPRAPRELAAALDALLADPARRARMGAAGQRRAREHFHASSVMPRLEALYERLLASARVRNVPAADARPQGVRAEAAGAGAAGGRR